MERLFNAPRPVNEISDMGALLLLDLAGNSLGGLSDWMKPVTKPPREDLELGGLVDGNPVAEIHSDGDIKIQDASGLTYYRHCQCHQEYGPLPHHP